MGDHGGYPWTKTVTVNEVDLTHPALEPFGDQRLLDSLRSARVTSYFEVTPTGGRTLMRLSNGAPLLVEKKLGKGRILLLTSTADSAWNNLPLKTGYVPLVQSLVTHIAGGDTGSMDAGITAGTTKRWSTAVAHAGKRVRVVDPNLTEREVTLAPVDGKASGTFDGNHFAGVYRVVSAGGDLKLPALYAVNPPPEESRLERMTADELQRKLGPVDHEVLSAGALAGGGTRTDLALALVVVLILTLLFESWLGQRNYE